MVDEQDTEELSYERNDGVDCLVAKRGLSSDTYFGLFKASACYLSSLVYQKCNTNHVLIDFQEEFVEILTKMMVE